MQRQQREGTTTGAAPAQRQSEQQGQRMQQRQGMQQRPGTTTGANTRDQVTTQRQDQGAAQSMSGRFSVTAQQQSTIRQALSSRNVARINPRSINFRINTGVVVPRNISVVSVAAFPTLIELYPDLHDHSFFVVDDDIVLLDRSRRIVDVVPAGPRTRFARGGGMGRGGGGGSMAALDLSPEEIRIVQEVLIERNLLTGRPTGVLDARTRQALVSFQRRQGIQASGSIDNRTVAALGVSNRISATQSQTTIGQGRGQAGQQPSARQDTTGQAADRAPSRQREPGTTGQAGRQREPGTTGQAGRQREPGTTGQAGQQRPQAGRQQPPAGQTTGQAPMRGANQPGASQNMPSRQPQGGAPSPSRGQSDRGGSGSRY